jgi:hypothetical protein
MKCLSLKQPYAELLVSCKKAIEVRTWNTNFRGQFLVHASKKINEEACKRLKLDKAKLVTGAIVGKANLYGVISYGNKKSFIKDKDKHFADQHLPVLRVYQTDSLFGLETVSGWIGSRLIILLITLF